MNRTWVLVAASLLTLAGGCQTTTRSAQRPKKLRVAAIVTTYHHNSHADMIVSRLFQTDSLDGKGNVYPLELVSLYTDQVPPNDLSRQFAQDYHFTIYPTIEGALTQGTGKLAVDAVLVIGEHGNYPRNATGNQAYPKRRFLEQVFKVFKDSGRVVPVFTDKHLGDNWEDINWVYTTARKMHVPLMAGSSVPLTWHRPPVTLERGLPLDQLVIISYGALDAYGFHALEAGQSIAERREGGESGVKSVQALSGEQVWDAMDKPEYDPKLLEAALNALPPRQHPEKSLREVVPDPVLIILTHQDGLKEYIFHINGATIPGWSAAWKDRDGKPQATCFYTQEARPFYHFALMDDAITQMFVTGKPTYPVERTLLTSGALDALFISKSKGGEKLQTPYLVIPYKTQWYWAEPPPPPPDRPINGQ